VQNFSCAVVCRHNHIVRSACHESSKKSVEFVKLITRQPRYFSHKNDVGWITEVPVPGRHVYLGHHVGGLLLCRLKDPFRTEKRPDGETEWRFLRCVMESDGRMILIVNLEVRIHGRKWP